MLLSVAIASAEPRESSALPPAAPVGYALVVGSNRAGPGQDVLRYADDDARNVADVLIELGGYPAHQVELLVDPEPAELLGAVEALGERVRADVDQGWPVVATFYYSGHSRATSLVLGDGEVGIADLRAALEDVGATLTVVVLDACQSGAITRSKGVDLAPDFSSNSLRGLDTEGIVVVSSSSDDELSQESDELGGSMFTHHLVVGLRGAADQQHDGVVTLDEAYAYAYDRTVFATAQTALGEQHPTLDLDVRGHGGTVLTRPARSSARLVLPSELAADLLLVRSDTNTVVAEVHKAEGEAIELALVPGPYTAIARRSGRIDRCTLVVAPDAATAFADSRCTTVDADRPLAKGGPSTPFAIELGIGRLRSPSDPFVEQLGAFGFSEGFSAGDTLTGSLTGLVERTWFGGGLTFGNLEERGFVREEGTMYRWSSFRLGAVARATTPVFRRRLALYGQIAAGPTLIRELYERSAPFAGASWKVSGHLAGEVGGRVGFGRHTALFLSGSATWAPGLRNEIGANHDVGGVAGQVGLRVTP